MLVREWLQQLGVTPTTVAFLEERYPWQRILEQLEWLRYRNPRDPAAMLVSAVQGGWDPPPQALAGGFPDDNGQGQLSRERFPGTGDNVRLRAGERSSPLLEAGTVEEGDGFVLDGTAVDVRDAWAQLLAEMRMQMTRVTFDTWLGGTEVAGVHEDVVSIRVRDGYAAEWLQSRWALPIERTLGGIAGRPLTVRFLAPAGRG